MSGGRVDVRGSGVQSRKGSLLARCEESRTWGRSARSDCGGGLTSGVCERVLLCRALVAAVDSHHKRAPPRNASKASIRLESTEQNATFIRDSAACVTSVPVHHFLAADFRVTTSGVARFRWALVQSFDSGPPSISNPQKLKHFYTQQSTIWPFSLF